MVVPDLILPKSVLLELHLGKYNLQLGGDHAGMRLNKVYKESLDETAILQELDSLFAQFAIERKSKESFGDFAVRKTLV